MGAFEWAKEHLWDSWHILPHAAPPAHDEHAAQPHQPELGPGGGTPQAHSDAFGHLADGAAPGIHLSGKKLDDYNTWKTTDEGKRSGPNEQASKRIDLTYGTEGIHRGDEKLGDIATGEGRDRALGMITQDGNTGDFDSLAAHRCAAAALIGGALEGGGRQGLQQLIKHMEEVNGPIVKGAKDPFAALKTKLGNDELAKTLTVADMQSLQQELYNTLKFKMEGANENDVLEHPDAKGGINFKTVAMFMQGDDKLAGMFRDNHMAIDNIDNSGDGSGKHFVLSMMNDKGALAKVYDPEARNGGQMVKDEGSMHDYDLARKYRVDADHRYS